MTLTPARAMMTILGVALVVLLVSRLPDDVFAATQTALVAAAGVLVLLVAASVFLAPARRIQRALFLGDAQDEPAAFAIATSAQMREMVKPIVVAVTALAVAGVAAVIRG